MTENPDYLDEAVELAAEALWGETGGAVARADARAALQAAEPPIARHWEERGRAEAEALTQRLLDALQVAALGGYEERLLPEETVANPYEARKLVAVTQDYSGEYSCNWTPEGIDFIREAIEAGRGALPVRATPSDSEYNRGRREALEEVGFAMAETLQPWTSSDLDQAIRNALAADRQPPEEEKCETCGGDGTIAHPFPMNAPCPTCPACSGKGTKPFPEDTTDKEQT